VIAIPPDTPSVSVDPLLLEQVLVNLLDNAAKYAPLGSTITVAAQATANRVLLTIADEGPGIPPEALPHVFDKFYRAKASDSRIAGTGLGLAVARGFVEAFGGTLDAANRTGGRGAVLTLSLPAQD
jgi:two-component system sensor histidine kinase KdpD